VGHAKWIQKFKAIVFALGCSFFLWISSGCVIEFVLPDVYDNRITGVLSLAIPAVLFLGYSARVVYVAINQSRHGPGSSGAHGTAGFASDEQLKLRGLKERRGLLCGRTTEKGELIRFNEPGHLLTVAPTRTGKGVGAVIPNALTHAGSLVVIDPKGENARVTARARREMGQNVYVLDPFGVSGEPSAHFNPLDFIRAGTEDAAEDADLVAEMLAETEGAKSASSSHFEESAKMLLRGVILYVAETADSSERHLGEVRRLLTLPPEPFGDFLEEMSRSKIAFGSAARAANTVLSMADRERSGVISTARRHTDWLESPRFVRVLRRSDFRLNTLKRGGATVYVVLPPDKLSRYRAFNRLFVGLSLSALQRDAYQKPERRVLYLLDEIAQLGRLSPLESAVGVAAGYGITLWQFWQDLSQLRSLYKERWESFVSNAAVLQVFGVSDQRTAQYVSDLLGQTTVATFNQSSGVNADGFDLTYNDGDSISETARALLTADEVRRINENLELLFVRGCRPAIARKIKYYQDPEFAGLFDDNPMH